MSIRTPLRPLARVLSARSKGENPDAIERENLRLRHEEMRDSSRLRAEGRLLVLGLCFVSAFVVVGLKMGQVSATVPEEPRAEASGTPILAQRADIVDRNGRILATNRVTNSLYAQPREMVDPVHAAQELARIFPDLDQDRLIRDFTGKRKFLWIKKKSLLNNNKPCMTLVSRACCLAHAKSGFIPTANWRRIFWAAPNLAAKA